MGTDAAGIRTPLDLLKAARLWLELLIDHRDIEPDTTVYRVVAVSPDGTRGEACEVSLAHTLAEIDAALASTPAAPPASPSGEPS